MLARCLMPIKERDPLRALSVIPCTWTYFLMEVWSTWRLVADCIKPHAACMLIREVGVKSSGGLVCA